MPDNTPQRGDAVTALPYYQDGEVTGAYRPREDYPDAQPPADAAWVDTGDPQGPIMVQMDSVRVVGENDTLRPDLRVVRDAAQALADKVRGVLSTDLTGVSGVRFPAIPRLMLPSFPDPEVAPGDTEPDKRHLTVAVTRVPIRDLRTVDRYRDDAGLTWTTYGRDDDFSTERMLEIINGEDQIIATYPAGAWIHVCYEQYLDNTDQVSA